MHELSILESMRDGVLEVLAREKADRVSVLTLAIGERSGVELDALRFAFPVLKERCPELAETELVVEEIPVRVRCGACGAESKPDSFLVQCEECGSVDVSFLSGMEIMIKSMEIE